MNQTPAQASGQPDFVNDWPVQGPTDPGMRAADCRYAQTLPTPQKAACADCKGPIPMWTQSKGLLGEQISLGGRGALGFALAAPGDPDVYSKFSPEQQAWVATTLSKLNDQIVKATGTTCPTWGPSVPAAAGCIQAWFNATYKAPVPGLTMPLRTDGVFDQDTFYALAKVASDHPTDFPTPFPGAPTTTQGAPAKKLSTGAMVSIAAAGAGVVGTVIYLATRGGKKRRK